MKTRILHTTIAAALSLLPAASFAQDTPPPANGATATGSATANGNTIVITGKSGTAKAGGTTSTSSSSVVTNGDGTATVTIDINGKKETRTFKLGGGDGTITLDATNGSPSGTLTISSSPVDTAASGQKVTWIGLAAREIPDQVRAQLPIGEGEGLIVQFVAPDSPAAKAGLQENDVLLRLEDQILVQPSQFQTLIRMRKAGDSVKLTTLRKGEKREISIPLGEQVEQKQDIIGRVLRHGEALLDKKGGEAVAELQEHVRKLKEQYPGVVVDSRALILGADGLIKEGSARVDELIEQTRRELEGLKITPEERAKVQTAVGEALRAARDAEQKARDAARKAREAIRPPIVVTPLTPPPAVRPVPPVLPAPPVPPVPPVLEKPAQ